MLSCTLLFYAISQRHILSKIIERATKLLMGWQQMMAPCLWLVELYFSCGNFSNCHYHCAVTSRWVGGQVTNVSYIHTAKFAAYTPNANWNSYATPNFQLKFICHAKQFFYNWYGMYTHHARKVHVYRSRHS